MSSHQEPSLRVAVLPALLWVLLSLVAGSLFAVSQTRIVGAVASGTDVHIQVAWSSSMANDELVLLDLGDGDGVSVSHQWTLPDPGQTSTVALKFALEGAITRSPHLRARLQDTFGVDVAASYPMQVMLTCNDGAHCAYEIDGGHAAPSMIYMRPAMDAALQEAEASGAQDLLMFVLDHHPELAGDVYSTAWQMGVLTANMDPVSGCTCQWTMTVDEQDSDCGDTCGSTHFVSVERGGNDHPVVNQAVNGSSIMTVDLQCWSPSSGGAETVLIEGEGEVDLGVESVGPCATECGGSVLYRGTYALTMGGETGAAGDSAVVVDTATFSVGSGTAFQRQFTFGVGGGLDDTSTDSATQSMVTVPGTSAVMSSTADVSVYYTPYIPPFQGGQGSRTVHQRRGPVLHGGSVGNDTEPDGYAWAWTDAFYRIEADVQSACTGSLTLVASTESSSSTPKNQGTDDISILVGKCDG